MTSVRVQELGKELSQAIKHHNNKDVIDILDALSEEEITVGLLQATGLGKMVNGLKKGKKDKPDIVTKATQLVDKWKDSISSKQKQVQKQKHGNVSPIEENKVDKTKSNSNGNSNNNSNCNTDTTGSTPENSLCKQKKTITYPLHKIFGKLVIFCYLLDLQILKATKKNK
ncbi:hypothetical protein RFI_26660 [Reticulomyxa filosa]|uniref:TFIIS N-terminal domain-containing protein n=1 Tax=Reticulomyxa filosa TaxID=46433 RepID=X6M9Z6_RETFI|nr:hypothetical protein RFI_26660 [Reticulomyxa filosa]|eukprot:ETO10719.1 hypothetical protein RFI_26660 [Reticulomyxa filosa]